MKNCSYNLVRALAEKCRLQWRYKQYLEDCAKEGCKSCSVMWEKLRDDEDKHIEMLRNEIAKKVEAGDFN